MDTTYIQQSSDGFKSVIEYESYLQQRRAELIGQKTEWKPVKRIVKQTNADGSVSEFEDTVKETLPDGSTQDKLELHVTEAGKDVRLMNDAGADYIIRNLRKFYNKHIAMGDVRTNAEAAKLAARAVQSVYAHVMANSSTYGIAEEKFSALEGEFDTDVSSLYLNLTGMRDHGIRGFGENTQKGQYNTSTDSTEDKGFLGLGKR
jgi:hypothetical protein